MKKPNSHHPQNCWVYAESYTGKQTLVDCRLPLASHIGWTNSYSEITYWQQPEPDNFNLAVFARTPQDCPFVDNQVFYYDKKLNGWVSMCCEFDKQKIADYIAWATTKPIIAYWYYPKAKQLRQKRKLLEIEHRKCEGINLSMNERLFQLNYYDKLKYKCDNEFIVERRIGTVRMCVLESQQEVESQYDLED